MTKLQKAVEASEIVRSADGVRFVWCLETHHILVEYAVLKTPDGKNIGPVVFKPKKTKWYQSSSSDSELWKSARFLDPISAMASCEDALKKLHVLWEGTVWFNRPQPKARKKKKGARR